LPRVFATNLSLYDTSVYNTPNSLTTRGRPWPRTYLPATMRGIDKALRGLLVALFLADAQAFTGTGALWCAAGPRPHLLRRAVRPGPAGLIGASMQERKQQQDPWDSQETERFRDMLTRAAQKNKARQVWVGAFTRRVEQATRSSFFFPPLLRAALLTTVQSLPKLVLAPQSSTGSAATMGGCMRRNVDNYRNMSPKVAPLLSCVCVPLGAIAVKRPFDNDCLRRTRRNRSGS